MPSFDAANMFDVSGGDELDQLKKEYDAQWPPGWEKLEGAAFKNLLGVDKATYDALDPLTQRRVCEASAARRAEKEREAVAKEQAEIVRKMTGFPPGTPPEEVQAARRAQASGKTTQSVRTAATKEQATTAEARARLGAPLGAPARDAQGRMFGDLSGGGRHKKNRRKSTRRKSTRRKSTRRKSTRRKTKKGKSKRRKSRRRRR